MKVEVRKGKKVAVLAVVGSLDADSVSAFKKIAHAVVGEGYSKLLVDASRMQFVDSMGLGVLISLLRKVRAQEGDLKITGLSAEVHQVFEMTRLHRLFEIFPTLEEAEKTFS